MKFLHTMLRVRDLDAALDFYVNKLGLQETSRRVDEKNRYTLVFLAAPGDVELVKKTKSDGHRGAPLVELVSDGPLKLCLNVPSRLLRTLKVGQRFDVDIDETGKTYPAKVTAINARVDAVAQTVELEARIDGRPPELLAGMTGIARFPQ